MDELDCQILKTLKDAKADLAWLDGIKKDQLLQTIRQDASGLHTIGFINGIRGQFAETKKFNGDHVMKQAMYVAEKMPMHADPTKIVFFSGTSQSRAEEFVFDKEDYNVVHTTMPGALLAAFQLFDPDYPLTREQRYAPWNALSRRLAHMVRDNATAILDVPKPTATFVNYEMPTFLLENHAVQTVNGIDKWHFWDNLTILGMDKSSGDNHKRNVLDAHKQRLNPTK